MIDVNMILNTSNGTPTHNNGCIKINEFVDRFKVDLFKNIVLQMQPFNRIEFYIS